jgi:hypothetical protein
LTVHVLQRIQFSSYSRNATNMQSEVLILANMKNGDVGRTFCSRAAAIRTTRLDSILVRCSLSSRTSPRAVRCAVLCRGSVINICVAERKKGCAALLPWSSSSKLERQPRNHMSDIHIRDEPICLNTQQMHLPVIPYADPITAAITTEESILSRRSPLESEPIRS